MNTVIIAREDTIKQMNYEINREDNYNLITI